MDMLKSARLGHLPILFAILAVSAVFVMGNAHAQVTGTIDDQTQNEGFGTLTIRLSDHLAPNSGNSRSFLTDAHHAIGVTSSDTTVVTAAAPSGDDFDGSERIVITEVGTGTATITVLIDDGGGSQDFPFTMTVTATHITAELVTSSSETTAANDLSFSIILGENIAATDVDTLRSALDPSSGTVGPLTAVGTGMSTFNFQVTGVAEGAFTLSLPEGSVNGEDSGLPNREAVLGTMITVDRSPPMPVITPVTSSPANGDVTYRVNFGEAITGFESTDITPAGKASTPVAIAPTTGTVANQVFDFTIQAPDEGVLTVTIPADAVADDLGNGNTLATNNDLVVDRTAPVLSVTHAPVELVTNAQTIVYSVQISPFEITTVAEGEIVANAGSRGTITGTGASGDPYRFSVTGLADGDSSSVTFDQGAFTDEAGNPSAESVSNVQTIDRMPPVPVISTEVTSPVMAEDIDFEVDFGEAINIDTLMAMDINVTSGTVTDPVAVTGVESIVDNQRFRFTVQGPADGLLRLNMTAGSIMDVAGNENPLSANLDLTVDNNGPTATITADQTSPTNADSVIFTITFNEVINDSTFENVDLTVPAGFTVTGPVNSGDDMTYTATVTGGSDGVLSLDIDADALDDVAGNGLEEDEQGEVTIDRTPPVLTLTTPVARTNAEPVTFTLAIDDVHVDGSSFDLDDVTLSVSNNPGDMTGTAGTPDNRRDGSVADTFLFDVVGATNDGTIIVTISAGSVLDQAGNGNEGDEMLSVIIDRVPPEFNRLVLDVSDPDLNIVDFMSGSNTVSILADNAIVPFELIFNDMDDIDATTVREVMNMMGALETSHGVIESIAHDASHGTVGEARFTFGVDLTGEPEGNLVLGVNMDEIADDLGNLNTMMVDMAFTHEFDNDAPTPVARVLVNDPTGGSPVPFVVDFDTPFVGDLMPEHLTISSGEILLEIPEGQEERDHGIEQVYDAQHVEIPGIMEIRSVATDASGNIYVLNQQNDTFSKYGSNGVRDCSMDNAVAVSNPSGIAVIGGVVYVGGHNPGSTTMTENVVFEFDTFDCAYLNTFHSFVSESAIHDVTVDDEGNIYAVSVGSVDTLTQIDTDGNVIGTVSSIPSLTPSTFNDPRGLDYFDNMVFVADTGNSRVVVFDTSLNYMHTIDFNKSNLLTNTDFGANGRITDVAVGDDGRIYVTDPSDRIAVFSPLGNPLYTIGNPGADVRHFDINLNLHQNLASVAIDDSNGLIYVADRDNSRLQSFAISDTKYLVFVDSPRNGAPLSLSMPAGVVQDRVAHNNEASNEVQVEVDLTNPAPFISFDSAESLDDDSTTITLEVDFGMSIDVGTFATEDIVIRFEENGTVLFDQVVVANIVNLDDAENDVFTFEVQGIDFEDVIEIQIPAGMVQEHHDDAGDDGDERGRLFNYASNTFTYPFGGGDSSDWKKKPTFGRSWEAPAVQLVHDGFVFNGNHLDITDNWHTDHILTSSIIGEENTVALKVYSGKTLSTVSLDLGIPEIGARFDAEAIITAELARDFDNPDDYEISSVIHEQNEGLVDESRTLASLSKASCSPSDAQERCHVITFEFVVMAPLKGEVIGITAMDTERRSTTTYVNDGVEFVGEQLLAYLEHTMHEKTTSQDPAIARHLVQDDRVNDIWSDHEGYLWTRNSHDTWIQLTRPDYVAPADDPNMSIKTRIHSDFADIVQLEKDRAKLVFDAGAITGMLEESKSSDMPFYLDESHNVILLEQLSIEEILKLEVALGRMIYDDSN